MRVESLLRIGLQRLGHHDRPEIGAANTDVDEVGDRLAGVAFPLAGADLVRAILHVREDGVDLGHDVLAIDIDRRVGTVAQRDMKHRAILGDVDFLAREHLLGPTRHVALGRQRAQQRQRFIVDPVLGEIEEEALELEREFLETIGVLRKLVAHGDAFGVEIMLLEVLPGSEGGGGRAHEPKA
jgi:hypothetical protein